MNREDLISILGSGSGLQPINRVIRKIQNGEIDLKTVVDEAISVDSEQGKNAAWSIEVLAREKPKLIAPFIPQIIASLNELKDFRQLAILLHLLSYFELNAEKLSAVIDLLLQCLHRKEEAEYIQYYAIQILEMVVEDEPAFKREVLLNMESALPLLTKDYVVNQAKKLIQKCNK